MASEWTYKKNIKLLEGSILLQRREFQKALASYNATLADDPENLEALYGLGMIFQYQEDFERGQRIFQKSVEFRRRQFADLQQLRHRLRLFGRPGFRHRTRSPKLWKSIRISWMHTRTWLIVILRTATLTGEFRFFRRFSTTTRMMSKHCFQLPSSTRKPATRNRRATFAKR